MKNGDRLFSSLNSSKLAIKEVSRKMNFMAMGNTLRKMEIRK
jgi:hypothetical protein